MTLVSKDWCSMNRKDRISEKEMGDDRGGWKSDKRVVKGLKRMDDE